MNNETNNENKPPAPKKEAPGNYMAIGMCLGMGLGTAIGAATDNLALGTSMGMLWGMVVGMCIKKKPEGDDTDAEN